MSAKPLGPWQAGMVTAISPTAIRAAPDRSGAAGLLDALNVDIDRAGAVERRQTWALLDAQPAHSLFEHAGTTYGVVGGVLSILADDGYVALTSVTGKLAWTVLNGEPCFVSASGVYLVRGQTVIQVPAGTSTDDEAELLLRSLPGGSQVAYWNGRLLVVRGNSLLWSEPLRFGVYNPLTNFVRFEERIGWIAALDTGIYVGLRNSVRFLRGSDPAAFSQLVVAGPSWSRSGAVIPAAGIDPDIAQGAPKVAVWLSQRGFALGLPSGAVLYPQADRLAELPLGAGRLVVMGDRITVLSN